MAPIALLIHLSLIRNVFAFKGTFRPGCHHSYPGLCSSRSSTLEAFEPRIVVVGGGVGGLAVASRIVASYNGACLVTILEKNERVGGRCGSFERVVDEYGTFRHERGPSLLLLPDTYREIFLDCRNQSAEAFGLEMKQCVPAYKVIFEDGDTIDLGFPRQPTKKLGETERQSRETMNRWEDNGAAKWDNYMRVTSAFLDAGLSNFIEERPDLGSLPKFVMEALRDFAKAWPLKPHSDVLDAIFQSNKMKALASFQDLYVGLEPYRNNEFLGGGVLRTTAPAVFGLLAAIELHPSNPKSGGECSHEVCTLVPSICEALHLRSTFLWRYVTFLDY
jgi:phytoene dehydrogenase-like protein